MARVGRHGSWPVSESGGGDGRWPPTPAQLREAWRESTWASALQMSQPGSGGGKGEQRNLSHGPSSLSVAKQKSAAWTKIVCGVKYVLRSQGW